MRIFLKKKKWMAWVVMLVFLFVSIMPTAALAKPGNGNGNGNNKGDSSITVTVPTTDIAVEKIWNDEDNEAQKRPERITVGLYEGEASEGETPIQTIELTSDGDWEGAFENVPVCDEQGDPIQYAVDEVVLPNGYQSESASFFAGGVSSVSDLVEVTSCSHLEWSDIGTSNFLVARSANNTDTGYYVWTREALQDGQDEVLLMKLNDLIGKENGRNHFTKDNTEILSGDSVTFRAEFNSGETGQITIASNGTLQFTGKQIWTMFWYSSLEFAEKPASVEITNTYDPTIPEPDSTGNLLITKKVTGLENAKGTQKFNFVLSSEVLTGAESVTIDGEAVTKITDKELIIPVTVDLSKGGASAKVEGLPQGNYIINEVLGEKNSAVAINGYDFKGVALTTDKTVDIADKQATFTVGEKVSFDVAFENQYIVNGNPPQPITGNLLINKKVTGLDNAIETQNFNFVLSSEALKNYEAAVTVDEKPVKIDTENGKIRLPVTVVKDSGNVKVEGLPVGDYTLVEDKDSAAIKDYTLDVSLETEKTQDVTCVDDKATFTVDDSNVSFNVTFTNTYTKSGDGEDNGNTGGGNTGNENTGGNTGNENTGGNTGNENTGGNTGNENTGGNTSNENTGGNTGNENTGGNEGSNNDTDNTTTIVDEPTPLVNVPEEPMEEFLEEPIEEIEIDEPEVPLTEAPGEPVAIEEPEVPLGDAPKTGDSSNVVLFVVLMLAAGAGLVVTRRKFN